MRLISARIKDEGVVWLVEKIVRSFSPGLPLGNITSQLFANIYLHELDMFMKHVLKAEYYIRYCDDFVVLHTDKKYLENLVPKINDFLGDRLKMALHPNKVSLTSYRQGIDFLGCVSFPHHTILRPKTRKRMLRRVNKKNASSYLGMLKHCNSYELKKQVQQILGSL